ncbi:hypothetical protein CHS0354_017681 [Potamilus streckersoni]|uniref:Ig-like domain-containing protein n=1 Tax=Potamilus streckersoni TaxID=2493646 RepID=A0AAE0S8R6_9BIVA|nr:hypothetical protein CHS0354_017681 [Potamilus streckersoni]
MAGRNLMETFCWTLLIFVTFLALNSGVQSTAIREELLDFNLHKQSHQNQDYGNWQETPIQLLSVTSLLGSGPFQNVTIVFTASKSVDLHWLTDSEIPIEHLAPGVETFHTASGEGLNEATIKLPRNHGLSTLKVNLVAKNTTFELQAVIDVTGNIQHSERISSFTFFVPSSSEIGISNSGKTQFHVFVDTSQSTFKFAIVTADLYSLVKKNFTYHVIEKSAYSFQPDITSNALRLANRTQQENTYHADLLMDSIAVANNGGMLTMLSGCIGTGKLVKMLYMRRTLLLRTKVGMSPIPADTVAFITTDTPRNILLTQSSKSLIVIRCTAVGNPRPVISLMKEGHQGVTDVSNVTIFIAQYPFRTAAIYAFKSTPEPGEYMCVAKSSKGVSRRSYLISQAQKS